MSDAFRNPHNLPVKTCVACGRPFVWRKKWARDWENVRYCSDRCRHAGAKPVDNPVPPAPTRLRRE